MPALPVSMRAGQACREELSGPIARSSTPSRELAVSRATRPYSMCMMGEMSPAGRWDEAAAPGELAARAGPAAPGGLAARAGAAAPGGPAARGQLRASHQDRDRVVEILRVAAGHGRLTAEEPDERLEAAPTARTLHDLAPLTR